MSQTLKFGNKTWATKVGSTLAYNDLSGNYKPLPFAFTRSTSATRVNKEGLIEVVTNDRPRIDYTDTSDGVLLLEPVRTNLWTESEGTNITLNSPLGEFGFYTLKNSQISRTISASDPISFTFIVKKIDGTIPTITTSGGNGDLVIYVSGGSGAGISGVLTDIGNGFYKYELKIANTGGGSQVIQNKSGVDTYVSLIQFEVGSFPTSYIPTQSSARTRVAETASDSGNSEVFNDSEGVLFADISALADDGTYRVFGLSDGTTSNRVILYYNPNSNNIELFISSGGAAQTTLNLTLTDIKLLQKVAVKYKVNDIGLWINGFEVGRDTIATMPIGLNELAFDNGTGIQPFFGKTKEIGYYDTILTDLELETLTSYKSWTSMVNELNLNIIYNG